MNEKEIEDAIAAHAPAQLFVIFQQPIVDQPLTIGPLLHAWLDMHCGPQPSIRAVAKLTVDGQGDGKAFTVAVWSPPHRGWLVADGMDQSQGSPASYQWVCFDTCEPTKPKRTS